MNILGLTTATRRSSAAVVAADVRPGAPFELATARSFALLGHAHHEDETSHAEHLFTLIDAALATAGVTRAAIDLVACDVGPGSFTGVRVALASAQAIAFALGKPLAGVSSLAAMAAAGLSDVLPTEAVLDDGRAASTRVGRPGHGPVRCAALLDARRKETFLALFGSGLELVAPARHLPDADVGAELTRAAHPEPGGPLLYIVGEHAHTLGLPGPGPGPGTTTWARYLGATGALPDAAWIARLGVWAARSSAPEPLYLRPPDAKPMAAP